MNRTQQVLAGLLVAQTILAVALFWPRSAPVGAGEAPLLGVKADEILSLAVRDNQGNSVRLTKSGAQWVMPEAGDYPADAVKVEPLLTKLAEMKANQLVAQTPAAQRRLQVADDLYSRRVDVETPAGTKTVYVGTSGGAGSSHVRLSGQDRIYLVNALSDTEITADAASWTNPAYFVVPQGDVLGITLSNAHDRWSFKKGADGQWTMQELAPGETLNPQSVLDLLNAAAYVRLERPLGKTEDPAYGLAQPSAVITMVAKTDGGEKTYTLAIGAQDPVDNTYVVKSSESPYYVRVREAGLKGLVAKERAGFLAVAPTPTAGTSNAE